MRTYDEADAAAREGSPFSNGTEGEMWMSSWCERCRHDVDADGVDGEGCPLVLVAILGKTPSEWLRQSTGPDKYHCVEFRDRDDPGPGYEAPPDPPLPGQDELFSVEPHVRMFADSVIRPAEVSR